jgi:hypothetical protein
MVTMGKRNNGGLEVGAIESEVGDARRAGHPEGDRDGTAVHREALGGGAVGATAEVAVRVEEDRPRRRRALVIGVEIDRRRHLEQPLGGEGGHGEIGKVGIGSAHLGCRWKP